MYRNWASRSGCRFPSTVRELPCVLNPLGVQHPQHRVLGARVPGGGQLRRDAPHQQGRPREQRHSDPPGSMPPAAPAAPQLNCRSRSSSFLRPPPGRRIRPGAASPPYARSPAPFATVFHDAPVACATRRSPTVSGWPSPPPPAPASATAHPACGSNSSSCGPKRSTSSAFALITASCHATHRKLTLKQDASLDGGRGPFTPTGMGVWARRSVGSEARAPPPPVPPKRHTQRSALRAPAFRVGNAPATQGLLWVRASWATCHRGH